MRNEYDARHAPVTWFASVHLWFFHLLLLDRQVVHRAGFLGHHGGFILRRRGWRLLELCLGRRWWWVQLLLLGRRWWRVLHCLEPFNCKLLYCALEYATRMTPKMGGYTTRAPALDLTTSLRGDWYFTKGSVTGAPLPDPTPARKPIFPSPLDPCHFPWGRGGAPMPADIAPKPLAPA